MWKGKCFRTDQMGHEDRTHAKTAGRTVCMNPPCDEMQSAIKAVLFCLISVTTSDNKYRLSDAITENVFCHFVGLIVIRVTLDVLGRG